MVGIFGQPTALFQYYYFCNGLFLGENGKHIRNRMNKLQKNRLIYLSVTIFIVGIAASLILYALKKNINVFLTPSQITLTTLPSSYHFRLGGIVKKNSVVRAKHNLQIAFVVTDLKKEITVYYNGVLPDLFHEEKGVIAEGYLDNKGIFQASQVLAKHDENYMPKKVYDALRKQEHA
jgi:cytochrome c-type biogenesis protein CcmE